MACQNTQQKLIRERQSQRILENGIPSDFPCICCVHLDQPCIMYSPNRKCAECTRRGRPCEKQFHSQAEWDKLEKAEAKLNYEIAAIEKKSIGAHAESDAFAKTAEIVEAEGCQDAGS
jgi:hypothetical protein